MMGAMTGAATGSMITLLPGAAEAGPATLGELDVREWITLALIAVGIFLNIVAAIGVTRLPDLYCRMQAASKAGTLGVALLVLAVAVYFNTVTFWTLGSTIVLFLFLTAPIASHLIARSAYFVDVPRWSGTRRDELRGCYDWDTHTLYSSPEEAQGQTELRGVLYDHID